MSSSKRALICNWKLRTPYNQPIIGAYNAALRAAQFELSQGHKQNGPSQGGAFLVWRARKDSNLRPPGS